MDLPVEIALFSFITRSAVHRTKATSGRITGLASFSNTDYSIKSSGLLNHSCLIHQILTCLAMFEGGLNCKQRRLKRLKILKPSPCIYTRLKRRASCHRPVHQADTRMRSHCLFPVVGQIWNKLLASCNKVDNFIRLPDLTSCRNKPDIACT